MSGTDKKKNGKGKVVIASLVCLALVFSVLAAGGWWLHKRVSEFANGYTEYMGDTHIPGEVQEFKGNLATVRELKRPIPAGGDYTFSVKVTDVVQTNGDTAVSPEDGYWRVYIRGLDGKWLILVKMEVIGGAGEIRVAHISHAFDAFAIAPVEYATWTGNIEQSIVRNTDTQEWEASTDIFAYYVSRNGEDLCDGTSMFSDVPVYLRNANDTRVGIICQYNEKGENCDSATALFKGGLASTCLNYGVALVYDMNIPAGEECYNTAIKQVNKGCAIIFAYGEGYEDYIIRAAEENPDVHFFLIGGERANSAGLANYHNIYSAFHHAQYLAGVTAGMKLNEMISHGIIGEEEAKLGYITLSLDTKNISAYTAFFLGAKSVCPTVTMEVELLAIFGDAASERESTRKLIDKGCRIITHNMASPTTEIALVCHENGVFCIAYLTDDMTKEQFPDIYLGGFGPVGEALRPGEIIMTYLDGYELRFTPDTTYDFSTYIAPLFSDCGYNMEDDYAADRLMEIQTGIYSGQVHVFDTANFTVDGQPVTSYKVDIDGDGIRETEAIVDGCFRESYFRSAPYFDLRIDGINVNA